MNKAIDSRPLRFVLGTLLFGSFAAVALSSADNSAPNSKPTQVRKSTDPPVAAKGKLGQDLFLAIDHRDLKGVEALIAKGADPNARNGLEFTPLYIAAASFQPDVMQVLLHAGANPDATSTYGTPLTFAALSGDFPGAQMLLSLGVNPNAARSDGRNSYRR